MPKSVSPSKAYILRRIVDDKYHSGGTRMHAFNTVGKLYRLANHITCAIEWFWHGKAKIDYENGSILPADGPVSARRNLAAYEVIEYELVEKRRMLATEWMEKHSRPYKHFLKHNPPSPPTAA